MDEHTTDLGPVRERTDDERRATAGLLDVAGGGRRSGAGGSGPGLLAGVQRRAVRQHRRRIAGAAVAGVAALGVGALVVPAVVPGGGSGIVAALGLEDRDGAPSPPPSTDSSPAPADEDGWVNALVRTGDSLVLTDAQVEAFVAGVQGKAPGILDNDNTARLPDNGMSSSLTRGGWCRETDLEVRSTALDETTGDPLQISVEPSGTWSATWRADALTRGGFGIDVDQKVVTWTYDEVYPAEAESARSYVDSTGASSVRCSAGAGQDLAGDFRVLPPPLPGVVQAVAPVAGATDIWEVRTVGSADGSGSAVDLTVVLSAPTPQEAGRSVVPLLRQALERVTAREAVVAAALEIGSDPPQAASSTAPERVVTRPYGRFVDRALTLDQVDAVLPGAARAAQPSSAGGSVDEICSGPFRVPEAYSGSSSDTALAFEAPNGGGTTSVKEWLMDWTPFEGGSGPSVFGLDSPCGPAPEGQTWEPVTLTHDGADVPAVVRHPDGDPERWVVRVTDAAEPAVAVGLEIETTAASQADVATVVVPLLQAAQQQAYAANFVPSTP